MLSEILCLEPVVILSCCYRHVAPEAAYRFGKNLQNSQGRQNMYHELDLGTTSRNRCLMIGVFGG